MSDYMKEGESGFKKPKVSLVISGNDLLMRLFLQKKKAKRSARKADCDENEADGMDVDVPTFARRTVTDGPDNLVDDDDLQAALSRARRAAAKTKPKRKPEDLAAESEPNLTDELSQTNGIFSRAVSPTG